MTYKEWNNLTEEQQQNVPENELPTIPQSELQNGLTMAKMIRVDGIPSWEIQQGENPSEIYPEFKQEPLPNSSGKPLWYKFDPMWGIYNMDINPEEWEASMEEEPIGDYGTAWMKWMKEHHKGKVLTMQLKHIFLTVARSVDKAAWKYRELLDSQYAAMNPRPMTFEEIVKWETTRSFYTDVYIMRATIHYTNEEFEKALELDFKALKLLQTHYSEENADIGTAYNSIAREYYSLSRFDTALEYFLTTHKIYENVYGENDSDTAEVCGSIAKTYMALSDYNPALEWCLKALQAQENTLGYEHPEVILRCSFISDIYENLGLIQEAIVHLKRILDFLEKNDYVEGVAVLCGRIADDYEKIGNSFKAK